MSQPSNHPGHKSALESFKETIESLILAFILAFVFRAFVVEAFVIPTGSMADTLRGAHFRLTCPTCSHQYNFGFTQQRHKIPKTNRYYPENYVPPYPINVAPDIGQLRPRIPICPMCGTWIDTEHLRRVSNGDRILVQKYIYQFLEPKIWDVVVFKNPVDPTKNFIKRLVGRPGETIQLKDGDVYINDKIQRKPTAVQDALWLEAYNIDYEPPQGRGRTLWQPALEPNDLPTFWRIDPKLPRLEFNYSGMTNRPPLAQPHILNFNRDRLHYIVRNFAAYNGPGSGSDSTSRVSDLKFTFILTPKSSDTSLAVQFSKYDQLYTGRINFDGTCTISGPQGETILTEQFPPLTIDVPIEVSFAVVDHRLELRLGENMLRWDGPDDPSAWGYTKTWPTASLLAYSGNFVLDTVKLYRDTHYSNIANGARGRATEETGPFQLGPDEFFVLGDNSPASHDSRFWAEQGIGNGDITYTPGVVPRDYLVGRAFFVYWPAGFLFPENLRLALIPNVGQMRFIH